MYCVHLVQEAIADPLVTKYITEGMKKVNEKSVSRAAKVQVSYMLIHYVVVIKILSEI